MENINFALVYLGVLVFLLLVASVLIFNQIFKARRTEGQLSKLQQKLVKGNGTPQEYYELGSLLLDKKLYAQAIGKFKQSLKASQADGQTDGQTDGQADEGIQPQSDLALVYNALGFAYFAQEQYDLAIRQYKEALRLAPDYTYALNNLGHAYERKQLTTQALEIYESVLEQEPNNKTARNRSSSLKKRLVSSS